MELEVEALTGAGHGERNPEQRLTHRNGDRERDWETGPKRIDFCTLSHTVNARPLDRSKNVCNRVEVRRNKVEKL